MTNKPQVLIYRKSLWREKRKKLKNKRKDKKHLKVTKANKKKDKIIKW